MFLTALEPAVQCYRFIVKGRVQGVYFRQSSKQRADALGLTGWVRNAADGMVDGEVCGAPAALDDFRDWLSQGPPAARVDHVSWVLSATSVEAPDFEVRR